MADLADGNVEELAKSMAALDAHMKDASYVKGVEPTQKDVTVFNAVSKPDESFMHALRWYNHIASFSAAKVEGLPGEKVTLVPASAAAPEKKEKKEKAPKEKKEKAPKPPKEKKEQTPEEKAAAAAKELEKLHKKVIKEGGKKGVEIEGASDMGGLDFFCTTIESPDGDLELLQMAMAAMNAQPDPDAEDRKGCSGHVGKMVFSAGVEQLAIVSYVPADKLEKVDVTEWTDHVVAAVGGTVTKAATDAVSPNGGKVMEAAVKADKDKGKFPLKDKDAAMAAAFAFLRSKGAFPEDDGDDSDEVAFGDDAFEDMGFA